MIGLHQFHFETLQENAPDNLDLLLSERQADAAMPASAESDQSV
jgi:hypothetical protein